MVTAVSVSARRRLGRPQQEVVDRVAFYAFGLAVKRSVLASASRTPPSGPFGRLRRGIREQRRYGTGRRFSHFPIFALSHFLILILPHSHIAFVTFRALVRIRGRKFGIITINERSKPMNNEPNKPVELTEKELEDIVGGGLVDFRLSDGLGAVVGSGARVVVTPDSHSR